MLSLPESELAGSQAESVLFGLCCLLFPTTLYVSHHNLRNIPTHRRTAHYILTTGTVLLFALTTIHWGVNQTRAHTAFILLGGQTVAQIEYLVADSMAGLVGTLTFVVLLILDALLVYRVHIIWGRSFTAIVPPLISFLGSSFVGATVYDYTVQNGLISVTERRYVIAAQCFSLATNVQAVALIAYRILRVDRAATVSNGHGLISILLVLVESASLVGLIIVAGLIAEVCGALTVTTVIIQMAPPLAGISFCLITLRVALAKYLRAEPGEADVRGAPRRSDTRASVLPMHVRVLREDHRVVDSGLDSSGTAKGASSGSYSSTEL